MSKVDETTDVEERYIANVIVGTLLLNGPGKIFLLTMEYLKRPISPSLQNYFIIS